jgi:hypothetical protein
MEPTWPDPGRQDAETATYDEFDVPSAGAAALVDAYRAAPWPAGLLSRSLYVAADGDGVRHYAQWSTLQPSDVEPPGVTSRDGAVYRLYRGGRQPGGVPGAVALIRVDTDGEQVARAWVDAVYEALGRDTGLPSGGIGAFFHISTDGKHVLNYAEWESAEAHRRALAASDGNISSGPLWDRVRTMPGIRHVGVHRFLLYATLTAPLSPPS